METRQLGQIMSFQLDEFPGMPSLLITVTVGFIMIILIILLRYTGGLSVEKFMKKLTWQKLTPESNRSEIKTNSSHRRTMFLYTHFQLPDFEEHPENCFPDLLDWRQRASPGWKEWRVTQGISTVIFVLAFLLIRDNYPALYMIDYDQGERCEAWEILPWREVCASPTVIWGKMFQRKNGPCKMLALNWLRRHFFTINIFFNFDHLLYVTNHPKKQKQVQHCVLHQLS